MGTSKVILLTGIYITLGFYTVSFTAADETNFSASLNVAVTSQAEQLAKTGRSLALQRFADNAGLASISDTKLTTMGGSVTYSAVTSASDPSQRVVTATGVYNGSTVQTTSVFHYYGGRWKVLREFSKIV